MSNQKNPSTLENMTTAELMKEGAYLLVGIANGLRDVEESVRELAMSLGVPEHKLPATQPSQESINVSKPQTR